MFLYLHEVQDFEYVHKDIIINFPDHFTPEGELIEPHVLYDKLKGKYMNKPESILVSFGQLSPASMSFNFNFKLKTIKKENLKSV